MPKQIMYKFYCEIPKTDVRIVLDVLEGVATNCKLIEIMEDQSSSNPREPRQANRYKRPDGSYFKRGGSEGPVYRYASKMWPLVEEIFLKKKCPLRYNDADVSQAIAKAGYSPNVSPMWTAFVRMGKVRRIARGMYVPVQLPGTWPMNDTPSGLAR